MARRGKVGMKWSYTCGGNGYEMVAQGEEGNDETFTPSMMDHLSELEGQEFRELYKFNYYVHTQ